MRRELGHVLHNRLPGLSRSNSRYRRRAQATLLVLLPGSVQAQLPLSIEALLMPPATHTLSLQGSWQQDRQAVLAARPDGAGGALLSVRQREIEQGSSSVGARFGLVPGLEFNTRLSNREIRWRDPQAGAGRARGYAAELGMSWLALPERGAPALLLDVRADLLSRMALPDAGQEWLDALELGATVYRSLDPLVLSLSARYRHQGSQGSDALHAPATDHLFLAPQVNFAVNADVTLVAGVSLHYRWDAAESPGVDESRLGTALRLGIGYAAGRQSTLFVNTNVATSGSGGAGFDLEWLYRFQ